ncbi:GNAT family N-acetyltransferase [Chishuiella changwenlii]|jgi:predicted GNAT family acetyltransferase|uniref:GNAT family N-acetyltransferase n=1 Tax=Chishuiella changwenlii TaxID=1434701 RepID=UPI002FDA92A3
MEFVKTDDGKKGMVQAIDEGKVAGEMTYTWAGNDKIIIDHTHVDEAYGGQGIGKKILINIIDWLRSEGVKAIPLCPFAKAQFDKNEEFRDVLS